MPLAFLMDIFSRRPLAGVHSALILGAAILAACASGAESEVVNDDERTAVDGEVGDLGSATGGVLDNAEPIFLGPSQGGAGGATSEECLSMMMWGGSGKYGAVPGNASMNAVADWLNEESTAVARHLVSKPVISLEFLEDVDLLLLHDLSGWEMSEEEVGVVRNWVRGGGALFALSGYREDGAEVPLTNRLVSFSNMSYVGQSGAGDTALMLRECAYCLGSTFRQEGWIDGHPISVGVTAVGAYQGRSIQGDGEVVAQQDGKILAMAKSVDEGRVFLFHDDWVSYRSQWEADAPAACHENPECAGVSPMQSYQVAQFWYNAIRWLVPERECFRLDSTWNIVD